MSTVRGRLVAAAGVITSAVALYLVLNAIDVGAAIDVLTGADPRPLLAILGVVSLQVALRAFRWSLLLPTRDDGEPSRRERIPMPETLGSAHVMTLGPLALAGALSIVGVGAKLGEVASAAGAPRRA